MHLKTIGYPQIAAIGLEVRFAGADAHLQSGGTHHGSVYLPCSSGIGVESPHYGPIGHICGLIANLDSHFCIQSHVVYHKFDVALSCGRIPADAEHQAQAENRAKGSFLHVELSSCYWVLPILFRIVTVL